MWGRAGREGVAITLADPRESRLLRQFELQTKGKIEIAQVPTVADLRARRLELTRAALREAILAGGLDHYRVAVETLAQEHDLMDIALAAVKLAHQASGGDREEDEKEVKEAKTPGPKAPRSDVQVKMSRIYVGAGRLAGVLPQNLVGAVTAGGIKGNLLGAIEICDKYSLVELPEQLLDDVVRAMRNTLIKGKKVVVRRFVEKVVPVNPSEASPKK